MKRLGLAVCALALLCACGSAPSASGTPAPSPTAGPTSAPSMQPASPVPPAGFVRVAVVGGAVSESTVTAARAGRHPGYDRFVIVFGGGVPSFSVTPQSGATFTRSPKGDMVTLEGTGGVLIVIHSVTNWTSYTGPTEFRSGYPYLRQALQVENFEGYQQWALGIQGTAWIRVFVLGSPNRLVVDVVGVQSFLTASSGRRSR